MSIDPMKLAEVAVVGFLFYVHMIVIGRKLDRLADAVYSMGGKKKEETR